MALLAPNEGEIEMLKSIVRYRGDTVGDTLILRLYDSSVTPAEGDTWLTYSESDGSGYSSIALRGNDGDSWSFATGGGDTTAATYPQQTFTYTGGDTLYGYYVSVREADGDTIILWAEEFSDGPYTIPGGGGTVRVTPRLELE